MTRRVTLVCGPPCAGKSTYVEQHATPDDHVVDHDLYARAAGSPAKWKHPQAYRDHAEAQLADALDYLHDNPDEDITVWVIRSAPEAETRQAIAEYIHADDVVLLVPDRSVLMDRARRRAPGTARVIDTWLARHTTTATTAREQPPRQG